MATVVPVTFRVTAMPQYAMNPQVFAEAMAARLSIEAADSIAFFSTGSVLPTSDQGPFLLNGITWYVWDTVTGAYIPETLDYLSLKSIAQAAAPDQTKYTWWTVLDGAGKATDIQYYSGGAWKSIFEDKFATYSTTSQMDAAITAALVCYPASAQMVADQSLAVDTFLHKINFDSAFINPNTAYDTTLKRYIAPVSGYYRATANVQVDNNTGTAAAMEIGIRIAVNGNPTAPSMPISGTAVASPPGDRWYPQINGIVQCAANDYIEIFMSAQDGVNTGSVTVSLASQFFVELVQKT